MSQIASKNLYELLGNDPELDPDRAPEPPTKAIDKPIQRTGKRNAGPEPPLRAGAAAAAPRGGREGAPVNRPERRDDGQRGDRRPREGGYRGDGRGRGRGGRGRGGDRPPRDDRHSHTGIADHPKQAAQGWGGEDGNAEWADEKAGDAIASAEVRNEPNSAADGADPAFSTGPDGQVGADDVAEEEKTKTYEQYLAEQEEKRAALGSLDIRKPNEGSKQKFPEGKAFSRDPADEDFIAGTGGKTRKAKDTTAKKEQIVVDGQYYAPAESGDRGGRGGRGGRGSRGGRGEFRGDRGGRGRGRGGEARGGAPRGNDRGPRGGAGFNATDSSAFPALGGN